MAVVEACFADSAFFFASRARRFRSARFFARSHTAGVLFRCRLCFRRIGGNTGRGRGLCRCGCLFRNCLEWLRGHRADSGFKICKVSTRFLQGSYQIPSRFLPGFCQLSQLHQSPRVDSLRCLCWGAWGVVPVQKPSSLVD